ncbi:MAG: chemotaxis protein CheW [Kouleothrix sp.]|nr:chemotaxis protein CheW [Kouleothrix sp.]
MDVLLVQLAGELYAIPSASVREVIRYRAYTPVPGAPPALPGILIQRGAIVPVVEIYPLLGIDRAPITRASRLVLVTHGDVDMAMLVDMVLDLAAIPADAVEPAPVALDPARVRFLRGVVQHERQFVALLDLNELIAGLSA